MTHVETPTSEPSLPARAPLVAGDPAKHRARERRRALARAVRRGLLAALVVAAGVGAVLALRPRPVPIDAGSAAVGPLVVAIEESGVTRVKDRYVLSAPVSGSVTRLSIEPGDVVKEGDVLAVIVPVLSPLLDDRTRVEAEGRESASLSGLGQAKAQASRAAVAKELAEVERARVERLVTSGSMPTQALDNADFELRMRAQEVTSAEFATKVATEELRIARAAVGHDGHGSARDRHVDVLAPVSGRVLRVHQKSAGVVQAGALLVEVGDPSALEVVVDLLTTDAVHIEPGTAVTIDGWGGDTPLAARVRRIEPSAFTRPSALGVDEQRVNVIVALTDPREKWSALADAYRVEARLVLWRGEAVLKVPQGALFRHGDGWGTFRIARGTAELRSVVPGHRGETEVEIVSGLAAGDVVAVHPGDRVKDGVSVEVR